MATKAHCAYCFECLTASFDDREPAGLGQIQAEWNAYDVKAAATPSPSPDSSHPLFVTWNTSKNGRHSLRGCIGTFEPLDLTKGLQQFAITSAFHDTRFAPIPAKLLASLQVCVTLLTNFSEPTSDPLDWTVGTHGIRIKFTDRGRSKGATYLPDVAAEQGWTKEEAIVSLMRKAGWNGDESKWREVADFQLTRYEGAKVGMEYAEYKAWLDHVEPSG